LAGACARSRSQISTRTAVRSKRPDEWAELDALLGIPVSRFSRDRVVFESIARDVLPALPMRCAPPAARRLPRGAPAAPRATSPTRSRSCGASGCSARIHRSNCASSPPTTTRGCLSARVACYEESGQKALPDDLRAAFERCDSLSCLRAEYRAVEFVQQDLREAMPEGPFDLVLRRNAVATYYAADVQRELLERIAQRTRPGAVLVLVIHESLPAGVAGFAVRPGVRTIYRRVET
jgi:chemotaxis protein methyltransferase CheR